MKFTNKKPFMISIPAGGEKDTGLVALLIILIILQIRTPQPLIIAGIVLLVISLTVPSIFRPLSYLWFGLSMAISFVMSKLIISIIFILVVTPLGMLRRLTGADPLRLGKKQTVCLNDRKRLFTSKDLKAPF
jgi:hypothetical protein